MNKDVKTIYRKDYEAPGFIAHSLQLKFELETHETTVESTMELESLDTSKPLFLNGDELELVSVVLDGEALSEKQYQVDALGLTIFKTPKQFTLTIKNKIKPHENTALSGLYQSGNMYCTQCEAHGFQRITYFLDRPDVLTTYTTTIVASEERYPVLLSNGNLVDKGRLDGKRHWVKWHDPFKKPSYLFALVAGDLACVSDEYTTASGRTIDLKLYTEHGNEHKCDYALTSLKKAMKWDEEVYGLEYDLDIFMIVAVSDFNMGAMENKGLNIFNAKCVLASKETATDDDFANIEGIVAHEYFHNWTGNRVTCRDWFQLSLKEGLTVFRDQEFSRDMNSKDVNRIKDVALLRQHQFPEDAGPMAHPVRPDEYIEINNFYTATVYNKGAEVIRMQHTILGEKGFRRGMDLYFERFDGQAVTIDDFVSSMEDANGADFSQLKRWYAQSGTPEVRVKTKVSDNNLIVEFAQYCPPTPSQEDKQPFLIPIRLAVFDKEGKKQSLEDDLFLLKEEKQTLMIPNVEKDSVLSLLQGFSAPIKLSYKQSFSDLSFIVRHEDDGFARYEAIQKCLQLILNEYLTDKTQEGSYEQLNEFQQLFLDIVQDKQIEPALKALLLAPPSFESMVMTMKAIDVHRVCLGIDLIKSKVARFAKDALLSLYGSISAEERGEINGHEFGLRALKNVCLSYLDDIAIAKSQFDQAKTMTDELAAFKVLVNGSETIANQAKQAFYDKWKQDSLVLDKWFAILALKKEDSVLSDIKELMSHEAFSIKNPNKVRALIGGFCMQNPCVFHSESGYELLREVVLQVDGLNPQTAARLITPFTYWRRYAETYQLGMKAQLEAILAHEGLSKDVYEIVSKSLK